MMKEIDKILEDEDLLYGHFLVRENIKNKIVSVVKEHIEAFRIQECSADNCNIKEGHCTSCYYLYRLLNSLGDDKDVEVRK